MLTTNINVQLGCVLMGTTLTNAEEWYKIMQIYNTCERSFMFCASVNQNIKLHELNLV